MNTPDLIHVHSVGYDLKNAKVEFNRELKLDVSNIIIEGKKGEILNIPRWVANVLESEKYVQIQDYDTLQELKQAITKEEVTGDFDLITLEPHFYIKIKSFMKRSPEKDYDLTESMLNKLVRKRRSKLVRLADSSKLTPALSQKLTVEEHEFYNQIHESSTKFSKKLIGEKT